MIIKATSFGSFKNAEKFMQRMQSQKLWDSIDQVCQDGVRALAKATPVDTGVTAASWSYSINPTPRGCEVYFNNSSVADHVPIVILLVYGHFTRQGAYVQGKDFVNPAIAPIFDKIASTLWKEVTR